MSIVPSGYKTYVARAVQHYWATLSQQAQRQSAGRDTGNRVAVTGGKQMDGFCDLVRWLVAQSGMPDASIHTKRHLELPGYFRATKRWDLLVVHEGQLVAVIEFKSHVGPSFGNNVNNRIEEALGNATDLWTAYREGALGSARPWAGWLMFLEACDKSTGPLKVVEPHFRVFDEFRDASYVRRYELFLRRLVHERLYDRSALLLSHRAGALNGSFSEPAADLSMLGFLAGLAGHVRAFLASR